MCKTNYPELKKMVERLDGIHGIGDDENRRRIEILQEIGKKLINEYHIQIDDVTVEPLLVEAYYYKDTNHEFMDCSCHRNPRQKGADRFGKLYFHKLGRGGVDICLSLKEYYLSFLIKVAKINGKVSRQIDVRDKLRHIPDAETRENILVYQSKQDHSIVCGPRKNTVKGKFAQAPLAIISIDAFINREDKSVADAIVRSLEHGKQWILAKYGLEKAQSDDIEKARKIVKEENLYSDKIEDMYMKSALEYIKSEEK